MDPAEEPASEVDSNDRAIRVAGEEAALPLELAVRDDVFVFLTGQQAELGRFGVLWRGFLGDLTDLWFDPQRQPQPGPIRVNGEGHRRILIDPDNLLGTCLIKRDGLWVAVKESQKVLKRKADGRLIEGACPWLEPGANGRAVSSLTETILQTPRLAIT